MAGPTTLVKQGAFDADLMNAINTNFVDTLSQTRTSAQSLASALALTGAATLGGGASVSGGNLSIAAGQYILETAANNITLLNNSGNATLANMVALNSVFNVVITANANNNGCVLPSAVTGMSLAVVNGGTGVTIVVLPQLNQTIKGQANNTGFSVANNNTAWFTCSANNAWWASQAT